MRPQKLEDFLGHQKIITELIQPLLEKSNQHFPSLIFWGPPGCGKTTLAGILASELDYHFTSLSAIDCGVKELRKQIEIAKEYKTHTDTLSIVFLDEIHRFNKAQQDSLLKAVEEAWIILIGATTENPSFSINNALISRCRILKFEKIPSDALAELIEKVLKDTVHGFAHLNLKLTDEAKNLLLHYGNGDARKLLNIFEIAVQLSKTSTITTEHIQSALQQDLVLYDKKDDGHYDHISALHKSIRNSNPDAALYYLFKMIEANEDPLFIARRLVRAAYEDIGLSDPQASVQAISAKESVEFLGYPECDVALAQACLYLALAPKSNSVYKATQEAKALVRNYPHLEIPLHLRSASTKLMKEEFSYGKNYQYDHDFPEKIAPMETMPPEIKNKKLYNAGELGFEKEIQKRIQYFHEARKRVKNNSPKNS